MKKKKKKKKKEREREEREKRERREGEEERKSNILRQQGGRRGKTQEKTPTLSLLSLSACENFWLI